MKIENNKARIIKYFFFLSKALIIAYEIMIGKPWENTTWKMTA
jgi:hypothetical protein